MPKITASIDMSKPLEYISRLTELAKSAGGSHVEVGVLSGAGDYEGTDVSVAQVAFWQEYGTRTIPERSFLRATLREDAAKIKDIRNTALWNILKKNWSAERALTMIGVNLVLMIQARIRRGIMPANAESTLKQKLRLKQGTTRLIRLGSERLINSITYRVFVK